MKRLLFAVSLSLILNGLTRAELTTVTITFDPPSVTEGVGLLESWEESGFIVRALAGSMEHRDSRTPLGALSAYPDNGSAYITAASAIEVEAIDPEVSFQVYSVDLAEYSSDFANEMIVLAFGDTTTSRYLVSTDLFLDGIIDGSGAANDFETFVLGDRFTNMRMFGVLPSHGRCSIDNIVLIVPEPGTLLFLILGGLGMLSRRRA